MPEPLPFIGPQFDADSLCAEIDPEIWYPEVGGSVRAAKELCRRCENQDACLEWALKHEEMHGVWGGTAPGERRRMLQERERERRLRDIKHGTEAGMKQHHRRGDIVPESDPCGCRAAARLASALRRERLAVA